jgi:glutamyl-tRNA synthetase
MLNSFLVGNHFSCADLYLWGTLKASPLFLKMLKLKTLEVAIERWFNFVKSLECVQKAVEIVQLENEKSKDRFDRGKMDIPLPGATKGNVVTRFPPEPSGYLHIGHAKAAMLNDYFAKQYEGTLILRYDDTNPTKEKAEFEKSIGEDLHMLEIKPDKVTYTSDSFALIHSEAIKLIKMGKAYVDDTNQETMQAERFDGIESKNRNMSVEDTLLKFEQMLNATAEGLKSTLRAKIDMQDLNKAMRDPVIYRCNLIPHHRTGSQWKIYPTYDFACPVVDSLEGVTHALRTIEYRDRNAQYAWFIKTLSIRNVR